MLAGTRAVGGCAATWAITSSGGHHDRAEQGRYLVFRHQQRSGPKRARRCLQECLKKRLFTTRDPKLDLHNLNTARSDQYDPKNSIGKKCGTGASFRRIREKLVFSIDDRNNHAKKFLFRNKNFIPTMKTFITF